MSEVEELEDNLYGVPDDEPPVPYAEQDLRILKGLISDPKIGRDFANNYDAKLFQQKIQPIAHLIIDYIKTYKTLPTKRIILEKIGDSPELVEKVNAVFDDFEYVEFDPKEYQYEVDKLKQNYADTKLASLRDELRFNDRGDSVKQLADMEKTIKEIRQVQQPVKKAYTQKSIDTYIPEFHQEYINRFNNSDASTGVLTGYSYLDHITNGMQPGEMWIVGGETGSGKASTLDTPIPTPDGFKLMRDIHPGDKIFGRDGNVYNVVGESQIWKLPAWKLKFNDGSEIISNDAHEWLTFDRKDQMALHKRTDAFREKSKIYRNPDREKNMHAKRDMENFKLSPPQGSIKSTKDIVATLKTKNGRSNHAVPVAASINLPERDFLISPYLLGCWLGDGTSKTGAITSMDEFIINKIVSLDYEILSVTKKKDVNGKVQRASTYIFKNLTTKLRISNLLSNKHIPENYIFSSKTQRLELLRGLMDTDGSVSKIGSIDFVNTNKQIIDGIHKLITSLGWKCYIKEGRSILYGVDKGPKWTVSFTPKDNELVFSLPRKIVRQESGKRRLNNFRYIESAERIEELTEMKCIQVDSPDHLYLVGYDFIPTHNSIALNNIAIQMWMQSNNIGTQPEMFAKGFNIQYFSLEMPYKPCFRRTMAKIADVPIYGLRDSTLTKTEIEQVSQSCRFIKSFSEKFKFEIVDIPRGVSVEQIEERYLEACANGNAPDVVVVDYLGLLEDHDAPGDDWLKLGYIAGKLHEFARAHNVRVLTAVQLTRTTKAGKASEPSDAIGVHRIGRSSLIMHHSNLGIQIETRKEEHLRDTFVYHIIKNRDGELGRAEINKKYAHGAIIDIPFKPQDKDDFGAFISGFDDEEDISEQVKAIWNLK